MTNISQGRELNPSPQTNGEKMSRVSENTPLQPRYAGTATHQVVAGLLAAGARTPDIRQIVRAVNEHPASARATTYKQAAKQRLVTGAACYFRFFAPPADWKLVSAEAVVGRVRLDLLFETPDGLRADELKTGKITGRADRDAFSEQVHAQVLAGVEHLDGFLGVRACLLAAPRRSYVMTAAGEIEALSW